METAGSPAVLILNLPSAALAGIDLLSFTATPKFRGIKNLPPGLHFVFVGSTTAFSERHGIWFDIPSRSASSEQALVVTKWDPSTETLDPINDPTDLLHHRANLGSIWREYLTPYRQQATNSSTDTDTTAYETLSDWPSLTCSITPALLSRITANKIHHLTSASSSAADLEAIPGLTTADLNHDENHELHFLPINLKQTWRAGATGRERTDAAQDRSWALENLVENHCSGGDETEVVGELQFCFLMILTLNNFSCLEQWRRLLSLLFTCKTAVPKRPDLFISAIATLRLQLQHCKDAEAGLVDLADEGGSLLKTLLVRFRKGLTSLPAGHATEVDLQSVRDELDDLEEYLSATHGWVFGGAFARTGTLELEDGEQVSMDTTAFDEDEEAGEFAPVMVELSEAERRALGMEDEVVLHQRLGEASLNQSLKGTGETKVQEEGTSSESEESGSSESSLDEEMDDLRTWTQDIESAGRKVTT